MRKGKNRYIVEVNDWGCGLMIKDTLTGGEIDAPEDEVITLCIKEMNSLAKELDTVRSVAQGNQDELKATRIENARLKAEVERLTPLLGDIVSFDEYHKLLQQVERLTKAGDAMADELKACYRAEGYDPADSETIPKWNAAKEGKPHA
jgi:hypothetical protein